jgi:hypothetical protein
MKELKTKKKVWVNTQNVDKMTLRSLDSNADPILASPSIKGRSPNWETQKTLRPALSVATLMAQCWTKKNDTMLIHSQNANKDKISKVQKNQKANWEKSAERSIILTPETSYSKYSARKTKQRIRAVRSIK